MPPPQVSGKTELGSPNQNRSKMGKTMQVAFADLTQNHERMKNESILNECGTDIKLEYTTDDILGEDDIKLECPEEDEDDAMEEGEMQYGEGDDEYAEEGGEGQEFGGEDAGEAGDDDDEPQYICYLCNKVLKTEKYLEKHLQKHNEDAANVYSCLACDKVFETQVKLKRHIKIHSNIQPAKRINRNHVILNCPICDKTLTSKLGLTIHVQRHSSLRQTETEVEQPMLAVSDTLGSQMTVSPAVTEFPCLICHAIFNTKASLGDHMELHNSQLRFECPVCNKRYTTKGAVTVHMRMHSADDKPYSCNVCGKRFRAKGNMTEHVRIHASSREFTCRHCDKSFKQRSNLTVHLLLTHGERTPRRGEINNAEKMYGDLMIGDSVGRALLQCRVCDKILSSKRGLAIHMQLHMLDDSGMQQRDAARRVGGLRVSGPMHGVMTSSGGLIAASKAKVQYECVVCGKFLATKYSLEKHIQLHAPNQNLIECGLCGRRFRSMKNMLMHVRLHTGERPYACTRCDKRYTQRSNLITHSLLAHGERVEWRKVTEVPPSIPPMLTIETIDASSGGYYIMEEPPVDSSYEHLCSMCAKQFKTAEQLAAHERVHNQQYPLMCDDCGKTFQSDGEMNVHKQFCQQQQQMVVSADDKPYRCTMCTASFSYPFSLNAHQRRHTGEDRLVSCAKCNTNFTDKWALKRHERTHCLDRVHRCWVCSKLYTNKPALTIHMRTHSGAEKPFLCTECGGRFMSKNLLRVHQRVHAAHVGDGDASGEVQEYSEVPESDGSNMVVYQIL